MSTAAVTAKPQVLMFRGPLLGSEEGVRGAGMPLTWRSRQAVPGAPQYQHHVPGAPVGLGIIAFLRQPAKREPVQVTRLQVCRGCNSDSKLGCSVWLSEQVVRSTSLKEFR